MKDLYFETEVLRHKLGMANREISDLKADLKALNKDYERVCQELYHRSNYLNAVLAEMEARGNEQRLKI